MSATLSTHRIKRFVLQGRTPYRVSVTAMPSATAQGYAAMIGEDWRQVEGLETSLPPHSFLQTGTADKYDAYKFCGDYDADERAQHAYMGAVAYRVAVPADAKTGAACKIEGISATAYGCRWLADGAIVAVIPSISATPPTWAEILAAADKTAALMAVTPANDGTDSTATAAVSIRPLDSGVDATTVAYVWVCLRLADYSTHRGAWIEGGAMLDAASMQVTYSRAVTADGPEEELSQDDGIHSTDLSTIGWVRQIQPVSYPYGQNAAVAPQTMYAFTHFYLPANYKAQIRVLGNPSLFYLNSSSVDLTSEGTAGTYPHGGACRVLEHDDISPRLRRGAGSAGYNRIAFSFSAGTLCAVEVVRYPLISDTNYLGSGAAEKVVCDKRDPVATADNSAVWTFGDVGRNLEPAQWIIATVYRDWNIIDYGKEF